MILFISGLPGSGKSTISALLAEKLGWSFVEADSFLSDEMKSRIKKGELLSQEQLDLWVMDYLIPSIVKLGSEQSIVVAGMLTEKKYVEKLSDEGDDVVYINLDVGYSVLEERVKSREHFAGEEMLKKCWEEKERFVLPGSTVDASQAPEKVVEDISALIK